MLFVVSGENFPDAATAAARAGVYKAPVLLTRPGSIPTETREALTRLRPGRVVVIGGSAAVSSGVVDQLRAYTTSGSVQRISSANRYSTAAALAGQYPAGQARVYLASGEDFPDALAGSALAGFQKAPMLLTRRDSLDASTIAQLTRLNAGEVVVLGGPGMVSDSVAAIAATHTTSKSSRRLAGATRQDTASVVAEQFPATATAAYVASNQVFADALVGAALAGRRAVPLMLTAVDKVEPGTRRVLDQRRPTEIIVLGGPAVINDATMTALGVYAPQALLGGYLGNPGELPDQKFNAAFGAYPDLASSYYQAKGRQGGTINRAYEAGRISRGTIPVLTVTSVNGPYTMEQIGSGAADEWIDYWRDELAALDGEVWFTFDHEFEVKLNQGKYSPAPTPAQYAKAFNRFQSRVTAGAPKVKFMYWYGYYDKAKIDAIGAAINPPDIMAIDPYIFSHHSPLATFESMAQPKLDWLRARSWYKGQPIIFAEFAKDTIFTDVAVAQFLTNLRPRMDALGISGAIYFCRDKPGDIMANITSGWPLSRMAFSESMAG